MPPPAKTGPAVSSVRFPQGLKSPSIAAGGGARYNGTPPFWTVPSPVPTLTLPTESATLSLGRALADHADAGDVITLSGPLGAGKTVLARGFLTRRLGPDTEITSPTYTLVHVYDAVNPPLWHFDLYRVDTADEIEELGLDEALAGGISLIEWPDRAQGRLPDSRLDIELDVDGKSETRQATLSGSGTWQSRVDEIVKAASA